MAASRASSSSWRSSPRRSRSPTTGFRASTSSPSGWAPRGKTPSSSPTRQMTRCGTDRIGTIVQTVRLPVRKFARVGRPPSRPASSARTSGSRNTVVEPGPAPAAMSANSRSSSPCCQASSPLTLVSPATAADRVASQSATGLGPASRSTARCTRSASSASRPARSTSPLPTSSMGRARPSQLPPSSAIVAPSRMRSSPARQVPCGKPPSPNGSRWPASRPQRTPESAVHRAIRSRSSSVKEKRRRTGGHAARSSSCDAVTRASASSSSFATVASSGLVCTRARSASRTRRRCAGWPFSTTSARPKAAVISGAYTSMSGHITRMSRGSSDGSSASSPRSTSRSTSTCRLAP